MAVSSLRGILRQYFVNKTSEVWQLCLAAAANSANMAGRRALTHQHYIIFRGERQ